MSTRIHVLSNKMQYRSSFSLKSRIKMPASVKQRTSRDRCSHSIEHLKNETRKSIWFAFQTLVDPKNGMVHTHTLKVGHLVTVVYIYFVTNLQFNAILAHRHDGQSCSGGPTSTWVPC